MTCKIPSPEGECVLLSYMYTTQSSVIVLTSIASIANTLYITKLYIIVLFLW